MKPLHAAIVLPARLESTRLPRKLLLDRTGRTVLAHTIGRAQEAQLASAGRITRILVAADHPLLVEAAEKAGATAVLTDPNHTSGTDRVAEAAAKLTESIIVNLQADEPEIDPAAIVKVAELMCEGTDASMSTLCVPIRTEETWRKPNVVKVALAANGNALYFSRAPIPHVRDTRAWFDANGPIWGYHHLGIYAYQRDFLLAYKSLPYSMLENLEKLEQLRALEAGHRIRCGVIPSNPPGVDTPEEYEAFVARMGVRN